MPNDAHFETLLFAAKNGDAAAEQTLLKENLPLVYAIAKRYGGRGVETEDLHQLGSIGLLKAIRRFDSAYGVCFSTYAVPMIAGEIKRFLRDDGIIRYSRSVKELAVRIRRLIAERPDMTLSEVASITGASEADVAAALASDCFPRSLDEPDPVTGDPMGNSIAAKSDEMVTDERLMIADMMESLSDREQAILKMRYFEEKTQAEIGKTLGVSQVQISRIEKKILLRLRSKAEPI